jgi:hypothetical protein
MGANHSTPTGAVEGTVKRLALALFDQASVYLFRHRLGGNIALLSAILFALQRLKLTEPLRSRLFCRVPLHHVANSEIAQESEDMSATSVTPLPLNIGDKELSLSDFDCDSLTCERTALTR